MVYFGNKSFSSPRRDTPNDRMPLFILVAVAGFVALILYLSYSLTRNGDVDLEVQGPTVNDFGPRDGAEELPPLPAPEPQTPFVVESGLPRTGVSAIVDVESVDYLLQRFLLDVPVKNEGPAPAAKEFEGRTEQFAGRRFTLELELADAPYRRVELMPMGGRSGVTTFYEAWGLDYSQAMHRVLFVDKQDLLKKGTPVVVEADFLQIYEYAMNPVKANNMRTVGRVPNWVARTVQPRPAMELVAGSWSPLFWVAGVMFLGVLVVIAVVLSQRVRAPRQRVFKMGSSSS